MRARGSDLAVHGQSAGGTILQDAVTMPPGQFLDSRVKVVRSPLSPSRFPPQIVRLPSESRNRATEQLAGGA